MEYLAPSLEFLRKLQAEMKSGKALSLILPELLSHQHTDFHKRMRQWWFHYQNGHRRPEFSTHYQRALVTIIESGLSGAPIFEHLEELEEEVAEELKRQIDAHLESLPFKLLLPLVLLFFPAFIILLFGPLLNQFLLEVGL